MADDLGDRDDDVLVSDAERQLVVDVLRGNVGDGRITLDEFADRVGLVWSARTRLELNDATRQLPVVAPLPPMATTAATATPAASRPRRFVQWTVAIMSGHERTGRWTVKGSTNAFAMMGGCKLDLRSAEVEGPELNITAVAIMGGIDIIVPEGITVDVTGFAFMGGKDCKLADVPAIPGAPVIRVQAYALMGGVSVRSRRHPAEEKADRERRRAEREKLRAERQMAALEERRQRSDRHRGRQGGSRSPSFPMSTPAPFSDPAPAPASPAPTAPAPAPAPAPTPAGFAVDGPLPGAMRAPGIPVAPDGTVTILFTDIEGFTAMTARLGDLRAQEVLRRHNDVVRQQVAACGGYEVKSQGDGFMIAFAGAAKALRCATGIQRSFAEDARLHPDSPVRVRIGLHTGEALRVDDDFHGNAVNLASRIAGTAVGGEILVSSLLRELTEGSGEFTFGQPRRVTLKGFDGERDVYPLGWAETADA